MSSPTATNTAKEAFRDIGSLCARGAASPRGAFALAALFLSMACGSDAKAPAGEGSGGAAPVDAGSGGTPSGGSGGAAAGGAGTGGAGTGGLPDLPDAMPDAGRDAARDAASGDASTDAAEDGSSETCSQDQKSCGGICVDVDHPAFGCTAVSCVPCDVGDNAEARCEGGACVLDGCAADFADCNGSLADACETALLDSAENCGACGNVCRLPHATATCDAGICRVASCAPGFEDCDGEDENGCEAETENDPARCGGCTTVCTATPGASATCETGTCGEMNCPIGLADCDDSTLTGCETNLGDDEANCGACGRSCGALPRATSQCQGGVCRVVSCEAGWDDCDGVDGNGCEVELAGNALHCGQCGRACEAAGASSARCEGGECFQLCDFGTGDCSHPAAPLPDDGCETDTTNDADHCGACGSACSAPSGTAGCSQGTCVIVDCPGNSGDCDGDVENGCETDLLSEADHCGACGRPCSSENTSVRLCSGGTCAPGCFPGFGDCSEPAAPAEDDGCETETDSNLEHCGGCGRACSTENVLAVSCAGGVCDSACEGGFGNCLRPTAGLGDDGCETAVDADTQCGSCDNDCTEQGGGGSGLRCTDELVCGCAGNAGRCNVNGASGTCSGDDRCVCGGVTCQPGEECSGLPAPDHCACNGASACAAGTVCCQTPAGCADLGNDEASCGACGHACPPGFTCEAGVCSAP